MSFLYPRTVTLTRREVMTAVGVQPYGAPKIGNETGIASGIPASIQVRGASEKGLAGVSTGPNAPTYRIMLPGGALAAGAGKERDILTDDLGRRFQVASIEWEVIGVQIWATMLEG